MKSNNMKVGGTDTAPSSFDSIQAATGMSDADVTKALKGSVRAELNSPKIVLCGDSITDDSEASSGFTDWGWGCWFRRLAGDSCVLGQGDVKAIASMGTVHLLEVQLPEVLAGDYDICITMIGTNDLGAGIDVIGNLTTFYDTLAMHNITAVAMPILPHSSPNSYSLPIAIEAEAINRYLSERSIVDANLLYINTLDSMTDFTSGDAVGSYLRDGIHTNRIGAKALGLSVYNAMLSALLPHQNSLRYSTTGNTFDATTNLKGNWLTNGFCVGSGGTLQNGASGIAPDDFQFRRSTPSASYTLEGGREVVEGYGNLNAFKISFSGTGDGNLMTFIHSGVVPSGVEVGDTVEFSILCDFKDLKGLSWVALRGNLGGIIRTDGGETSSNGIADYDIDNVTLKADILYNGTSSYEVRLQAGTTSGSPLSGDILVKQVSVNKL